NCHQLIDLSGHPLRILFGSGHTLFGGGHPSVDHLCSFEVILVKTDLIGRNTAVRIAAALYLDHRSPNKGLRRIAVAVAGAASFALNAGVWLDHDTRVDARRVTDDKGVRIVFRNDGAL